jgi:hypothetical protein
MLANASRVRQRNVADTPHTSHCRLVATADQDNGTQFGHAHRTGGREFAGLWDTTADANSPASKAVATTSLR